MAPKAVPAPIISPSGGAGSASDDSVSPTGSVQGRQQMFLQALEEASTEAQQQKKQPNKDVFPYGLKVPFKARDAVPGDKCASARVFLSEAPIQALKDMCFYLQMDETGTIDDLASRIVDYFVQLFPEYSKAASKSSKKMMQQKLASGATPMQRRLSSGGVAAKELSADSAPSDLKARLTELGKPTYGSREVLWKNLQKAEAEQPVKGKKGTAVAEEKKKRVAEEEPQQSQPTKKAKMKEVDKMQKQYCVAGMTIAAQMRMALEASISSS